MRTLCHHFVNIAVNVSVLASFSMIFFSTFSGLPGAKANCVVGIACMTAYNGMMTAHPYILPPSVVCQDAPGMGRCPGPPTTTAMDFDL